MIYSTEAQPLIDELLEANRIEGLTIANLSNALKNGVKDSKILLRLTKAMEDAHSAKMDAYDRLQAFRLDN